MKVALVSNLYGRLARGGAEVMVKKIAEGFIKRGDAVFVISAVGAEAPKDRAFSCPVTREVEGGVLIYRFYPPNIYFYAQAARHGILARLIWTFLDVFNWRAARRVRQIILEEKPDMILLHNLKGLGYYIPRYLADFHDKVILTLHDVQLINPSGLIIAGSEDHWFSKSLPASLYRSVCRRQFNPIKKVISPSRFLLDFYRSHGFLRGKVHPLVLKNPSAYPGTVKPRQPQTRHVGVVNLLFVGQLEEHKGIKWLVDFLENNGYFINGFKVCLRIAGDGLLRKRLLPTAGKLLGKLDFAALKEEMLKADYLVFPSICYENSPAVIYEALSLGLPVIASNIGGVAELVQDNFNGFLFKPAEFEKTTGDYLSFRSALVAAGQMTEQDYGQMSLNAQKSVEDCVPDRYIEKLLEFWRSGS